MSKLHTEIFAFGTVRTMKEFLDSPLRTDPQR
jgi:hypothetical protein